MKKNYDQSFEINDNPKWSYIPDHAYRTLIIGGLGSGKINLLLNLVKYQGPDIDKKLFVLQRSIELKYELIIN